MKPNYCIILACAAGVFFACNSRESREIPNTTPATEQSAAEKLQQSNLKMYTKVRKKVTDYFDLPATASAEEVRPFAARYLKLRKDASWADMLKDPWIKSLLTDERRKKYSAIFTSSEDATWIELKDTVERLWATAKISP